MKINQELDHRQRNDKDGSEIVIKKEVTRVSYDRSDENNKRPIEEQFKFLMTVSISGGFNLLSCWRRIYYVHRERDLLMSTWVDEFTSHP